MKLNAVEFRGQCGAHVVTPIAARNPALLQACGFAVLPIQRKPVTQ